MSYNRGETIICSVVITNSSGVDTDPDTSITIAITDPNKNVEVAEVTMGTKDSTGHYHYDWASTTSNTKGNYTVLYKAVDGTRTSITNATIELE